MPTPFDIPELVDRLIDYLHDDPKTLRSTSFVARSWRSTSQLHLVHDVVIIGGQRLLALRDELEFTSRTNSRLRHLVVRLSIENVREPDVEFADAVLDIMHFLERLEDLRLANIRWDAVPWDGDPPQPRDQVSRALRSLRLDWVLFGQKLHVFELIVAGISSIQTLVLNKCHSYNQNPLAPEITSNRKPVVHELYLWSSLSDRVAGRVSKLVLDSQSPRVLRVDCNTEQDALSAVNLSQDIGPRIKEAFFLVCHPGARASHLAALYYQQKTDTIS